MIDVFEGLNRSHDEADADARAAEDVFKGLDMVIEKCTITMRASLLSVIFYSMINTLILVYISFTLGPRHI